MPHLNSRNTFEVLDASHREIVLQLEKLDQLRLRLEHNSPVEADQLTAQKLVNFFSGPAREHNYDEELHAFPALLKCGDSELEKAAQSLQEDHAWIELNWLDLQPYLNSIVAQSCPFNVKEFSASVEIFSAMMRDHIAVEEAVIYPQLRTRLTTALLRAASREIAARQAENLQPIIGSN